MTKDTCLVCGEKTKLIRGLCRKHYNLLYYRNWRDKNRQAYNKYHKEYYEKNKFRFNNNKRKRI